MKTNTYEDDPRVTAYVFGELDGKEAKIFEQEMESDPELRDIVSEFRAGAEILEEVVSQETASDVSLDPDRRKFLEEAIRAEQRRDSKVGWWRNSWRMTSVSFAAACLLIGIGFTILNNNIVLERATERRDISSISSMSSNKNEVVVSTEFAEEEVPPAMDEVLPLAELSKEPALLSDLELENSLHPKEDLVVTSTGAPTTPSMRRELGLEQAGEIAVVGIESKKVAELQKEKGRTAAFNTPARPATKPVAEAPVFASNKTKVAPGVRQWSGELSAVGGLDGFGVPAEPGSEGYAKITEKGFTRIVDAATGTSTFSADVDTASYTNIRRYLNSGQLPPIGAVRIEEMVNYFTYDYAEPDGKHPFASEVQVASCPWQPEHRLARIGIQAASIDVEKRQPMNLVFLIDVSGSMNSPNKLPLLKRAMKLMVKNLNAEDRVAMVTYAGSSGLVLESTPVSDKQEILSALGRLKSGGSTAGAAGIELAYRVARKNLIDDGQNRVILCTDGDFNVGMTDNDDLTELIRRGGKDGVFLNIFGFGMGNIKDDRLEQLSNDGNGTYSYIDSFQEAQKVFGEQLQGTLATVAKDVKFQIEFNPVKVVAYRLIGYENRMLAREDFNDDTKDAGEIGAGHNVTALYEIVPVGVEGTIASVEDHRYISTERPKPKAQSPKPNDGELFYLKIRYKDPDASKSQLMTFPVKDSDGSYEKAGDDFLFAAAVAHAGQLLRGSRYTGSADWATVLKLARAGKGQDEHGYRAEFIRLSKVARDLQE